jgi:hypothetical protein
MKFALRRAPWRLPMKKLLSAALAVIFSIASFNTLACSGEKAKDGKGEMSTPAKPKV